MASNIKSSYPVDDISYDLGVNTGIDKAKETIEEKLNDAISEIEKLDIWILGQLEFKREVKRILENVMKEG